MTLAGKHIIVTGGGSGVGATIAAELNAKGAKVTIMGRQESRLQKQNLPYQICDVTQASAVANAFEKAHADLGPISAVVANAGTAESIPFAKMSPDQLQDMLAVNLIGVSNVWQAALADMKTAGWGRLIAVASTPRLKGYPYVSAYCAAKHGVVGLTRAVALELASTDITVNSICPGFTETPLLERSVENIIEKTGMSAKAAYQSLRARNPQKRFIQTDEVAAMAVWLCSEGARSVTGQALSLSGGEI